MSPWRSASIVYGLARVRDILASVSDLRREAIHRASRYGIGVLGKRRIGCCVPAFHCAHDIAMRRILPSLAIGMLIGVTIVCAWYVRT